MNNDSEKITHLTPEMMQLYTQGTLRPAQMHAIEKFLLDNPFEAEAMESLINSGEGFLGDVSLLQDKLQARVKKTTVIPIWRKYYGIAAAVAIVLVSSLLIINLFQSDKTNEHQLALEDVIEKEKTTTKQTEILEPTSKNNSKADDDLILEEKPSEKKISIESKIISTENEDLTTEEIITEDFEIDNENESLLANEANDRISLTAIVLEEDTEEIKQLDIADNKTSIATLQEVETQPMSQDNALPKASSLGRTARKKKQNDFVSEQLRDTKRLVRGEITSIEDGMPLPGVNVVIKGTSTGTITDIYGNYEIARTVDDVLEFSFIGFEQEELADGTISEYDVAMYADVAQFSEVVVTAVGISRETQSLGYSVSTNIESETNSSRPEFGYYTYRKYLKEALIYPKQALDSAIEGKVTVAFSVSKTGELTNFKIKKSLGYGCDEEAVRLIKEGTNWVVALENGVPIENKIRLKVKFELE